MRIADRFRTEGKFQCSNISCGFQMAPASLLRKLNATNFKGLQSIVKKCAAVLFSKPRNFVRLQPWQRERREIALDSLILWPDIERSCGKQSKGIVSFSGWNNIVPSFFHTFPVFYRNHLAPPIFYTFDIVSSHPDYCSQWTWSPYVSYILRFLTCNELIVHSSSSPPRGIHFWGFPNIVLRWCKAGPPHVSFNQK